MNIFSLCIADSGLSLGDWAVLLGGFWNVLKSGIARGPDEPAVDFIGFVYLLMLLALYLGGLVTVVLTLARERQAKIKHLSPAAFASPEADDKARAICNELDAFPPLDNKLIIDEMRLRIRAAAALGPGDPQTVARLNAFIDRTDAAARRKFAFPGLTTLDKHGCAVPLFVLISAGIIALNLIRHNCPLPLIPSVLFVAFAGFAAASLTPGYLRDAINTSFFFRLITGVHTAAGSHIKNSWEYAKQEDLIEVTFTDGSKKYFRRRRNMIVIMAIAFAVALLMIALSTYILLPLTFYLICRNYLLPSANTRDFSISGFSPDKCRKLLSAALIAILLFLEFIVLIATGFDIGAVVGTAFVLSPMFFIPGGYLSFFNSRLSVAHVSLPAEERGDNLARIASLGRKSLPLILLAAFCWMAWTAVATVSSARFYQKQEKIRKEKVAAREREQQRKAEEKRLLEKKKQEELRAQEEREAQERRRLEEERRLKERQERQREREEKKKLQEQKRRERRELRRRQSGKGRRKNRTAEPESDAPEN